LGGRPYELGNPEAIVNTSIGFFGGGAVGGGSRGSGDGVGGGGGGARTIMDGGHSPLRGWEDSERLSVLNLTYDTTPADCVSFIVCESGLLETTDVPSFLR